MYYFLHVILSLFGAILAVAPFGSVVADCAPGGALCPVDVHSPEIQAIAARALSAINADMNDRNTQQLIPIEVLSATRTQIGASAYQFTLTILVGQSTCKKGVIFGNCAQEQGPRKVYLIHAMQSSVDEQATFVYQLMPMNAIGQFDGSQNSGQNDNSATRSDVNTSNGGGGGVDLRAVGPPRTPQILPVVGKNCLGFIGQHVGEPCMGGYPTVTEIRPKSAKGGTAAGGAPVPAQGAGKEKKEDASKAIVKIIGDIAAEVLKAAGKKKPKASPQQ